jgi:hypothetical protein
LVEHGNPDYRASIAGLYRRHWTPPLACIFKYFSFAFTGASSMTNVFATSASHDYVTLGALNTRYALVKARLTSAHANGDQKARDAAWAEIIELDEEIGTVLAKLALHNAEVARIRKTAA